MKQHLPTQNIKKYEGGGGWVSLNPSVCVLLIKSGVEIKEIKKLTPQRLTTYVLNFAAESFWIYNPDLIYSNFSQRLAEWHFYKEIYIRL